MCDMFILLIVVPNYHEMTLWDLYVFVIMLKASPSVALSESEGMIRRRTAYISNL